MAVPVLSDSLTFCVSDSSRRIVSVSKSFLELTRFSLDECLGRNCAFLQSPETDPKAVETLRQGMDACQPVDTIIANRTKDGAFFWNFLRVVPVFRSPGPPPNAPADVLRSFLTHYVGLQKAVGANPSSPPDMEELADDPVVAAVLAYDTVTLSIPTDGGTSPAPNPSTPPSAGQPPDARTPAGSGISGGAVLHLRPADSESDARRSAGLWQATGPTVPLYGDRVLWVETVGDALGPAAAQRAVALAGATDRLMRGSGAELPSTVGWPTAGSGGVSQTEAVDSTLLRPAIRLGVSTCLTGEPVRWNKTGKRDSLLMDVLARFCTLEAVCPEVGMGLSTPRPTLRLVRDPADTDGTMKPRLICPKTKEDLTARADAWAATELDRLASLDPPLCGFVFKRDSPSSGMVGVRIYEVADHGAAAVRTGQGFFARAFMRRFPAVPVEEEGRLSDWRLRENFVHRMLAFGRIMAIRKSCRPGVSSEVSVHASPPVGSAMPPSASGRATPPASGAAGVGFRLVLTALRDFHVRHRVHLLCHGESGALALDDFLLHPPAACRADASGNVLGQTYLERTMRHMSGIATRTDHIRVMGLLVAMIKNWLSPVMHEEVTGLIEDYAHGEVSLRTVLTLIRHHAISLPVPWWLSQQTYLCFEPKELRLGTSCEPLEHEDKPRGKDGMTSAQRAQTFTTFSGPCAVASAGACGGCGDSAAPDVENAV
eukprot:TRINITY_DN32495_c0_g1_i1.p1 TRINITY_DN32495_c0_g1~~TRINITY_DN32495_c0_g1_i1.p1  ORF type:complete len:747 (+),score=80.88 TRINITY_DN32495_c0_g1_i1:103-2241(+)